MSVVDIGHLKRNVNYSNGDVPIFQVLTKRNSVQIAIASKVYFGEKKNVVIQNHLCPHLLAL